MAHIGIQRLGAGDRQHHRTHRDESDEGMTERKPDRVVGRKRAQDMGIGEDVRGPERRQGEEPRHHHRPEEAADEVGAGPGAGAFAMAERGGSRLLGGLPANVQLAPGRMAV